MFIEPATISNFITPNMRYSFCWQEELTNDPFPSVGFGQYRPVKAPTATSTAKSTSSSYESASSAAGYGTGSHSESHVNIY